MEQVELEQIIYRTKRDMMTALSLYVTDSPMETCQKSIASIISLTDLQLTHSGLSRLPNNIGDMINLTNLDFRFNQLTSLPESIGNLSNLKILNLSFNRISILPNSIGNLKNLTILELACSTKLTELPDSICDLSNLTKLNLGGSCGQLTSLPNKIGNLASLTILNLSNNKLNILPNSIGNLSKLEILDLSGNQITSLPESIYNLYHLKWLDLSGNQITDLSTIQSLANLETFRFFGVELPHRYWTKFSDWEPMWLLEEDNAEIRRVLIKYLGYEKICQELGAFTLDSWREYTLLKIDAVETVYDEHGWSEREPMVLLKMTCPSTQHIHILRVPPETVSAEAAITWVNHGIHPDEFAVQT